MFRIYYIFTRLPLRGLLGTWVAARDCLKTLELPNRRPYELLKRDTEGLFLQCCIAKNVRSRGHQMTFQTVSKGSSRKLSHLFGVFSETHSPNTGGLPRRCPPL